MIIANVNSFSTMHLLPPPNKQWFYFCPFGC